MSPKKRDLVAQFLAYETKRHRDQLQIALESMRQEIDQALRQLERGEEPCRPAGLANNLTDVFHRIGALAQLRQVAELTKDEPPAAPKVRPDRYRLKLSPSAANGAAQALDEWARENYVKLGLPMVGDLLQKMPARVEAGQLVCSYAGVEATAQILHAYANSPRGSVAWRRDAKVVAERLLRAKQASDEAAEE